MNVDRYNNFNSFSQPQFIDPLSEMIEKVRQPLEGAINLGDEEAVAKCINQCIATFAVGKAYAEKLSFDEITIEIEELTGSYAELLRLVEFIDPLLDISLFLKVEISDRLMADRENAESFFQRYGTVLSGLDYVNDKNEDNAMFQHIINCCPLDSLFIQAAFIKTEDLVGFENLNCLAKVIFEDCHLLSKLPALPEGICSLKIHNCTRLTEVTSIPKSLEEVEFKNHDEAFRAKLLAGIFNVNKQAAFELFESFEIHTYKCFIDFLIGWKNFHLTYYEAFLLEIVTTGFQDLFNKEYKLEMLKHLYKVYRHDMPAGKHIEYSVALRRFMDALPISSAGCFNGTYEFSVPTPEQKEKLSGIELFYVERDKEIANKIGDYLKVYPFFIEKKIKEKLEDKEYAKYYQNLFNICLPLLEFESDEPPLKKLKLNSEYAIDRKTDRFTKTLVQMALLDENTDSGEDIEIEFEHIEYLLDRVRNTEN